jgi:phage tail protein X
VPNGEAINNELEFQDQMSKKTNEQKVDWLCWHTYQNSQQVCSKQIEHEAKIFALETICPKLESRVTVVEDNLKQLSSSPTKTNIIGGLTGGGIGAALATAVIEIINFFQNRSV